MKCIQMSHKGNGAKRKTTKVYFATNKKLKKGDAK